MHPTQKKLQDRIRRDSVRDPASGCWVWNRQVSNTGYGRITVAARDRLVTESAHRMSYLAFVGPLGVETRVSQTCNNRLCVNPDHLLAAGVPAHGGAA